MYIFMWQQCRYYMYTAIEILKSSLNNVTSRVRVHLCSDEGQISLLRTNTCKAVIIVHAPCHSYTYNIQNDWTRYKILTSVHNRKHMHDKVAPVYIDHFRLRRRLSNIPDSNSLQTTWDVDHIRK